jgi:hypothetical protein
MNTQHDIQVLDVDPRFKSSLDEQSLEAALRILNEADRDAQIFTYDAAKVPIYQYSSADDRLRFTAELNELRNRRPKDPQGGCPIDLEGIKENDEQHWFTFQLVDHVMVALANPFAYLPVHTTIASLTHEPQSWRAIGSIDTRSRMKQVIRDLYLLAVLLPTFTLIFNENSSSGASLPKHRHYQAFELPNGFGPLAIQQAAARTPECHDAPIVRIGFQDDYPVSGARFSGDEETVVNAATDFLEKWDRLLGEAATANLIAVTENGQVCIYAVLRHALFRHAPGFAGIMGALEMAGSFIFSADWELESVRHGRVGFSTLWEMLASVRPPEARQLI